MSRDESPVVRAVSEEGGYTWAHRAFLQAFLTHSVLTVEEIKPVLANILTAHNPSRPYSAADITSPTLTSTIQTLNAKLTYFDLEIRSTKDQATKETVYALINNTSDALTQLATRFTPSEISYIRRLLDCMFETNNTRNKEVMAVRHTEASQLAKPRRAVAGRMSQSQMLHADGGGGGGEVGMEDKGISIAEADGILDILVQQGFFAKSRAGYFSLAPRALMELRTYLKDTYNESPEDADDDGEVEIRIRDCEGCREIVTFGIRCNDKRCCVRWHDACANNFYRGRSRENRNCPKCATVCGGDVYVGERAAQQSQRGSGSSGGGGRVSNGGAARRSTQVEVEEEEEEEEEEE